jgi:hypothetical protein
MFNKTNAEKIMEALVHNTGIPNPIITCQACGLPTERKDIVPYLGICTACYSDYMLDMAMQEAERSEVEAMY